MLAEHPHPEALPRLDVAPSLLRTAAARTVVALAILVGLLTAYNLIGRVLAPERAQSIATPLDDAIPFLPWTVLVYSWVYTSMLLPLFAIRCPRLFRRTVFAYIMVMGTSLLCFALWPVTAVGLRPDVATLDTATFVGWGVRLTYTVDPPYNLLPSLHLSVALTSALAVWRARPAYGVLAGVIAAGIAVSILTMKQHFVADGVGALVLAGAAWWLVLRPYVADPDERVSYTWRGPLAYLAFHGSVYGALYVAFRAGVTAW